MFSVDNNNNNNTTGIKIECACHQRFLRIIHGLRRFNCVLNVEVLVRENCRGVCVQNGRTKKNGMHIILANGNASDRD